jgi:hypothetical protein
MEEFQVSPAARPQWQQATALITLGAGGIVTGLSFVPNTPADLTSPASLPIKLLALERAGGPAPGSDAMLRSAIVHTARHFLLLAQTRSPAEMEALIWRYASTDGADHGPSCAAFASLTLELGSHMAGLDSWVTGGTSYPWRVHSWVDARVDPNPASPGVVSVLQDASTHGRWRPLGDGYTPQPGDWVLFDGHVEVVTKYAGGVLHTIGADSVPNMSVNAHEYAGSFEDQGIAGFVDNGVGVSAASRQEAGPAVHGGHQHHDKHAGETSAAIPGAEPSRPAASTGRAAATRPAGGAAASARTPALEPQAKPVPRSASSPQYQPQSHALPSGGAAAVAYGEHWVAAVPAPRSEQAARTVTHPERPHHHAARDLATRTGRVSHPVAHRPHRTRRDRAATADVPATGLRRAAKRGRPGEAAIPGLFKAPHHGQGGHASALAPYHRHDVPQAAGSTPGTTTQRAFINEVARGAMATQRRYGVPASVTIAQAIDESAWGQSVLATTDHNLFGIKGTGPAGADVQPTQEFINGQLVNTTASFRIYHDVAQSIDAHARLLARSGDYAGAMSQRHNPDAFAAALTGVYATDPQYGAKLIRLMRQYDLYRYDHAAAHALRRPAAETTASGGTASRTTASSTTGSGVTPSGTATPGHQRASAHRPQSRRQPGHTPMPPSTRPRQSSASPTQPARTPHPAPPRSPARAPHPAPATPGSQDAAEPQAATNGSGPVTGHAHAAYAAPAVHPGTTPYPGRSARPRPLAHPAHTVDLAPAWHQVHAAPQASGPGSGQQPGAGNASPDTTGPASHRDAARQGVPRPRTATAPADGTADAAIPGVPHTATTAMAGVQAPRAGEAEAGSYDRPGSPRQSSAHVPGATVPSQPRERGLAADAQGADAGRGPADGAAIPGVPHSATGTHLADHRTLRTSPGDAVAAARASGGNSIPGLPVSPSAAAGIRAGAPADQSAASGSPASAGGSAIPAAPALGSRPAIQMRPTTAPARSAPLASAPAGAAPLGAAPLGSAPAGSAPAGSAPAGSAPAGSAPAGSAPAGSAPLQPATPRRRAEGYGPARPRPAPRPTGLRRPGTRPTPRAAPHRRPRTAPRPRTRAERATPHGPHRARRRRRARGGLRRRTRPRQRAPWHHRQPSRPNPPRRQRRRRP